MIEFHSNRQCDNFAKDKAAFIASSLSRSRRSIILDCAMDVSDPSNPKLETDPVKVKHLANYHFQTIAGVPPEYSPSVADLPGR